MRAACTRCAKPAKPGRTRCVDCTKKAADWNRKRYKQRKAIGLCPACGSQRLTTRRECGDCRERKYKRNLKLLKTGSGSHMQWTISQGLLPEYLYVVLKGRFELSEFNQMLDEVSSLKVLFPDFPMLFSDLEFDVSRVKKVDLIGASSSFIFNEPSFANNKVAIVMKSEKDFALAGRWKSITQPSSSAILSIFRNERKAIRWLTRRSFGASKISKNKKAGIAPALV